jgi:hypothetical protein
MRVLRGLRRVGIAIGSFVGAWLCVLLAGTLFMGLAGIPSSPTTSATIVAVVLGGLVDRDIVRRESPAPAG